MIDRGKLRAAHRASLLLAAAAAAMVQAADPARAQAGDRWSIGETGAVATLPSAGGGSGIAQATLACAARRWTLTLSLAALGGGESEAGAVLRVDRRSFDTTAALDGATIAIAVPGDAIDPLKNGLRMSVEIDGLVGGMLGEVAFSLRGSRVAIDAADERCSLRDMTGYTPVTLTPYSSYMNIARELRAADVKAFTAATSIRPELTVAMSEFDDGRRILFTRLCGSSWYYGASGCNITGFAPEGEGWRIAYDTENAHLFVDPRSRTEGWPDLATLPVRGKGDARLWRWDGKAYALVGLLPEE